MARSYRLGLLVTFALLVEMGNTRAQTSSDQVAVSLTPRARPASAPDPDVTIRSESSLVQIPAHVTTATGASVTDLRAENFRITDGDVEQTIVHFSKDDAPVSIGLLLDISGSMKSKVREVSEAAASFFRTTGAGDEFFLIEFSDRAKLCVPFTSDADRVYNRIRAMSPFGMTSLLDAVYLGLRKMNRAHNIRKAMVIFSDGGDNWSSHSMRQVKKALMESDVQVYSMGMFDPAEVKPGSVEETKGPRLLEDLAEQSGGRSYPVRNVNDLPTISAEVGKELRNEYLLGYYPSHLVRDGKYHQVRLKLVLPDPALVLRATYRSGYYAAVE